MLDFGRRPRLDWNASLRPDINRSLAPSPLLPQPRPSLSSQALIPDISTLHLTTTTALAQQHVDVYQLRRLARRQSVAHRRIREEERAGEVFERGAEGL